MMRNHDNRALLEQVKRSKWSIFELAGLTDIPETSVYRLLDGRDEITPQIASKFAQLLDCRADELVSAKTEEPTR